MSVNKYDPHILVLPEDDANRQIANGFLLNLDPGVARRIQVLEEVGGWMKVLECFRSDHADYMNRYPKRFMVLLIDFDGDAERLRDAKSRIPAPLTDRVYVLGVLSEPERLRSAGLGSYETIGLSMADDCRDETDQIWNHPLLRHNADELRRFREHARPILFPAI